MMLVMIVVCDPNWQGGRPNRARPHDALIQSLVIVLENGLAFDQSMIF